MWKDPIEGVATPLGLGARTLMFMDASPKNAMVAVDIGITKYILGDNALIEILKGGGIPAADTICGLIEVANGNLIRLMGSALYQDPAVPLRADETQMPGFLVQCNEGIVISAYVTQTLGVPREVYFRYNQLRGAFP